jgi:hypothetical protein
MGNPDRRHLLADQRNRRGADPTGGFMVTGRCKLLAKLRPDGSEAICNSTHTIFGNEIPRAGNVT